MWPSPTAPMAESPQHHSEPSSSRTWLAVRLTCTLRILRPLASRASMPAKWGLPERVSFTG